MTFLEQMTNDFIPAIERMLENERMHLVSLIHTKQKLEKRNYVVYVEDMKPMIDKSKQMIIHFEHRLNEYREYVKNGNNANQLKIKELKNRFRIFFEGNGFSFNINTISILSMGITDLQFAFKNANLIELTVTLERPGLLIGKGGSTIDALEQYLSNDETKVKILIIESTLWR